MKKIPYLNPDAYRRFIGPKNWGKALIDDELTTCLLDNGSQLNFITPAYAKCRGMDVMSLDVLAQEIGGELPPNSGDRWHHGEARWFCYSECQGSWCEGL